MAMADVQDHQPKTGSVHVMTGGGAQTAARGRRANVQRGTQGRTARLVERACIQTNAGRSVIWRRAAVGTGGAGDSQENVFAMRGGRVRTAARRQRWSARVGTRVQSAGCAWKMCTLKSAGGYVILAPPALVTGGVEA